MTCTIRSYDRMQLCFTYYIYYTTLHTALNMTNVRSSLRAVHAAGEEEG